jgi:hypothetical protein
VESGTLWGSTLRAQISLATPSADPVWEDITTWVRPGSSPLDLSGGRQTDLPYVEPGRGVLALEDRDGRFTVGNAASPYYPWWGPGCRIRVRETVGAKSWTLIDGYVQMPTSTTTTQVVGEESDSDVTVTVSIVDLLGWVQSAGAWISTLGAHILGSDRGALVACYPLGDSAAPWRDVSQYGRQPLSPSVTTSTLGPSATSQPTYTPADGVVAPGDDLAGVRLTPATAAYGGYQYMARAHQLIAWWPTDTASAPSLSSGQCLTLVTWLDMDSYDDLQLVWALQLDNASYTEATVITLGRQGALDANAGLWYAAAIDVPGSSYHATVASADYSIGARRVLVGLQLTPTEMRMWIGTETYTDTNTGSGWSYPQYLRGGVQSIGPYSGTAAYAQIYMGDESSFTHDDFLDQREAGLYGLAGQSTGERVRALLGYTGIASTRLGRVDDGVARMSKASLAGIDPLTALRAAEEVEQGRLWIDGEDIVFADRRGRYDV